MTSERVDGAADASRSPIENMGVDHHRLYVAMAQKLLDGSNVIATFEQVGGEGMPESVASGPLGQAGLHHRVPHGFLNERFIHVVASLFLCLWIHPAIFLGEYPLPTPFAGGIGILAVQVGIVGIGGHWVSHLDL